MLHNLTGWHALIILAIVILVFGATKLPALAKSLGQSVRILKDETAEKRPSGPDDRNPEPTYHEAVTDRIVTEPTGTGAASRGSEPGSVDGAANVTGRAAENGAHAQPDTRARSRPQAPPRRRCRWPRT